MNAFCLGNNDDQHAPRIFRLALPRGVKERVSETSARKAGWTLDRKIRINVFFFFNWVIVSFILIVAPWNRYRVQLTYFKIYLLTSLSSIMIYLICSNNYIELFLFYYWYEARKGGVKIELT